MQKRALVWLIAGLVCAVAAVILVKKNLSRGTTGQTPVQIPLVKVLVASRDILYGEEFVLGGKPEESNVGFADWPEKYALEGAIAKKEELEEKDYVANKSFVKFEPILRQTIVERSLLYPDGWHCEELPVEELVLEQLRVGGKADVRKVTGAQGIVEFLRCLPVYAKHYLPSQYNEKEKRKPLRVYLLMPADIHDIYLDAKLKFKFIVLPAGSDCKDTEFVRPQAEIEREKFQAAATAIEEARQKEQWAAVLDLCDKAIAEWREKFPAETKKIVDTRKEAVNVLAGNLLAAVEAAMGARDWPRVMVLVKELEDEFPEAAEVVKNARALAEQAKQSQVLQMREQRYTEAVNALDKTTKGGNLPLARELVGNLERDFAGYTPPPPLESPNALCDRIKKDIGEKDKDYESMARLLEYYVRAGNRERALERYKQMKDKYPEHPGLRKFEEDMVKLGWL